MLFPPRNRYKFFCEKKEENLRRIWETKYILPQKHSQSKTVLYVYQRRSVFWDDEMDLTVFTLTLWCNLSWQCPFFPLSILLMELSEQEKSPLARILVKLTLSDGFAALFRQTAVVIQFVRQWTFNPLLLSGYYMHSSFPFTLYTSSFNFDNGSCRKKYDTSILRNYMSDFAKMYRICQNKRPGRLIFTSKKFQNPPKAIGFACSPLWNIFHQRPSVLCTPPLWEIIHHTPSILCTPPFEKSLVLVGAYFGVGVYFGKYGM